jgi:2-phosphoglycerate kinase
MVQGLDLKDGRREGRIFLLHGPSGVGKSFTAECVARSTGICSTTETLDRQVIANI